MSVEGWQEHRARGEERGGGGVPSVLSLKLTLERKKGGSASN